MVGFENPQLLGLLVLALPGILFAFKAEERFGRIVSLSHTLFITLLVVAAASPYMNVQQSVQEQREIVMLKDSSTSSQLMEDVKMELGDIEVRKKVISSGNSSDLRNGLMRNLEPNTAYLAVSDFQSSTSLKGLAEKFRQKNSTLSALKPEMEPEASVSIEGPSSTVPGARSSFTIEVHSTGSIPTPKVYLDGSRVPISQAGNGTWKFTETFSEKGSHTVRAKIKVDDRFSQNDFYYHAVDVTEKPDILILGRKGPMQEKLEKFYDVTRRENLPEDLSPYYAIIMKQDPSREPVNYVSKGNGIVYTGSYDRSMDILPVRTVPREDQNRGAKIMLAIDISHGTEDITDAADKIKQISYNLVEMLPYNNRVGAVAYNRDAYIISRPEPLAENRNFLKRKISQLKPSGPSWHHNGIKGARQMLNGTGNVILISDGRYTNFEGTGPGSYSVDIGARTKRLADRLQVKLITVGVGKKRNEDFLKEIAERGGGTYLDAERSGKLKFRFESGGASGQVVPLVTVNTEHFITQRMELSSAATYFDPVAPKKGGELLVTGTSGRPFLTTWRYGLGRVAAFSGGGKELSEVSRLDPLLLTRSVSWAVGDPKRKQNRWIRVENGRRPDEVNVKASYRLPGFHREGENLFERDLRPGKLGFHSIRNKSLGYNYNRELEKVGYSEEMRDLVRATGGEVYTPGDEQEIKKDLKQFSQREVVTKKNLSSYFLALALLLFLGEVGYRKMNGKK
ncbi:MAG: hypothetical protein ABEJ91_01955 [Candidatus Nanohaloarchaea archaeon]